MNSALQKLRNVILEILHRLQQPDSLRPYARELLQTVMKLLRIENEDNAVICLKIIIDLHRNYKSMLEEQVPPFLNIVMDMYRNMEQTVRDSFDVVASTPSGSTVSILIFSIMHWRD